MKNNWRIGEVAISVLLLVLVALCSNTAQQLWMPSMVTSMILFGVVVVFIVFAIFIWKEKARDEREEQHKLMAGRISFLVGAGLLVAGIIIQTLRHSLDSWLIVTLTGMVLAKLAARWYSEIRN